MPKIAINEVRASMKASLAKFDALDLDSLPEKERHTVQLQMKNLLDEYLEFEESLKMVQTLVAPLKRRAE
jgi:hypothetical protein